MYDCHCTEQHPRKRIVLTGGPGAGKTAVLEVARHLFCKHVRVIPEAAGIVFGGGFPRTQVPLERAASQRAIYHVQRELELIAEHREPPAIVLCDRGTVDGEAYWPGPGSLWASVGTTRNAELTRYDSVIHLRTPSGVSYDNANPLRIESAEQAAAIDLKIIEAWRDHPRRVFIESTDDFFEKARLALTHLLLDIPECCRSDAAMRATRLSNP